MNEKAVAKFGPLAAARKSSLLNQEEMAGHIGLSVPRLVELEKHPEKISLETLRIILDTVGADGKTIIRQYVDDFFVA